MGDPFVGCDTMEHEEGGQKLLLLQLQTGHSIGEGSSEDEMFENAATIQCNENDPNLRNK